LASSVMLAQIFRIMEISFEQASFIPNYIADSLPNAIKKILMGYDVPINAADVGR